MRLLWINVFYLVNIGALVLCNDSCSIGNIGERRDAPVYHEYCVIGAGPAGLQLAYFLKQAGRDYIVYERSNTTGSFFQFYPRHRRLISINKRDTGKTNAEFNLRHDWNSLLSHDPELLFKHYSRDYYPRAEELSRYLEDYKVKLGLNVQFNTKILKINREKPEKKPMGKFVLNAEKAKFTCKVLVVATGLSASNNPKFTGSDLTISYDDVVVEEERNSSTESFYKGKTVLILGRGNAAFETADAAYSHTNYIHMVSRSRARLSWSTHYVGDLRGINNAFLDNYQLKSLDGLFEVPVEQLQLIKKNGKIYVSKPNDCEQGISTSDGSLVWDNFSLREGYDIVVRCLGFSFDFSIFSSSMAPIKGGGRKRKYPAIKHNFESLNHDDMYFAGTATHSLDFRKSSGGFIHGFRYNIRAMHRLLERKYHGVRWPINSLPVVYLLQTIIKRINEVSALYQMFGVLTDVIVIREKDIFDYIEEFPARLLPQFEKVTGYSLNETDSRGKVKGYLVIDMEYGKSFSGPSEDTFREGRATGDVTAAHRSNFLHPVLYFYIQLPREIDFATKPSRWNLPKPDSIHHVLEDFLTSWTSEHTHVLPLRRFLENCLNEDMRHFWSSDCLATILTHESAPAWCRHLVQTGEGVEMSALPV